LKLMEDQIEAQRADLINRRENEQIKRDELSIAQAANDNSRDLLTSEMALVQLGCPNRRQGRSKGLPGCACPMLAASHKTKHRGQDRRKRRGQCR